MAGTKAATRREEHFGIERSVWLGQGNLALVLIDIQNYAVSRKFDITKYHPFANKRVTQAYFDRLQNVCIPALKELLNCFRSKSLPVMYLRYCSHSPGYGDMPALWRKVSGEMKDARGRTYSLLPEQEASQIIDEIAPRPGEIVLDKTTNGAFASTKLDICLRSQKINSIVVAGGWTNACVETTVREACDKGYLCVVPGDACFSLTPGIQSASLKNMNGFYALVLQTREIEKNMKKFAAKHDGIAT